MHCSSCVRGTRTKCAFLFRSWSLKCTQVVHKGRKQRRRRQRRLCASVRDKERGRQEERKTETGWTVHYTPDKGQRDVLFMSQAAAASGSSVGGQGWNEHASPFPRANGRTRSLAPGQQTHLLTLIDNVKTHTHTHIHGRLEHRLSITLNHSILIICCDKNRCGGVRQKQNNTL